MTEAPPRWAETLLRLFLEQRDFETVSGDLLEEYRESVLSVRGRRRADVWYVRQVLGFVWRGAGLWAATFSAVYLARTAMDWFVPTTDFHTRSTLTTTLGIGILLTAGVWAAWRSGSFAAGAVAGATTAMLSALISAVGVTGLLAIWHDPRTMTAIRGSGGLSEALTLPFTMVLLGAVLGAVGGGVGVAIKRLRWA